MNRALTLLAASFSSMILATTAQAITPQELQAEGEKVNQELKICQKQAKNQMDKIQCAVIYNAATNQIQQWEIAEMAKIINTLVGNK